MKKLYERDDVCKNGCGKLVEYKGFKDKKRVYVCWKCERVYKDDI